MVSISSNILNTSWDQMKPADGNVGLSIGQVVTIQINVSLIQGVNPSSITIRYDNFGFYLNYVYLLNYFTFLFILFCLFVLALMVLLRLDFQFKAYKLIQLEMQT